MNFTFDTTIERGDDEIEVRVTYAVSRYYPATYTQPAEGGEVVLTEATFMGAPLTEAEWEALRDEAVERAPQDGADAAADYGDYLYEQLRDRLMEEWA